jgi:hypothetical protein
LVTGRTLLPPPPHTNPSAPANPSTPPADPSPSTTKRLRPSSDSPSNYYSTLLAQFDGDNSQDEYDDVDDESTVLPSPPATATGKLPDGDASTQPSTQGSDHTGGRCPLPRQRRRRRRRR